MIHGDAKLELGVLGALEDVNDQDGDGGEDLDLRVVSCKELYGVLVDHDPEDIVEEEVGVGRDQEHRVPLLSLTVLVVGAWEVYVRLVVGVAHVLPDWVCVENAHHVGPNDVNDEQYHDKS